MATYLVTQATGHQSQWTIKHLLEAGAKVHAVVRDPAKVQAKVLKEPGVTIFQGNTNNLEEITRAAQGCKGAFLNTFPIPGIETEQAKTVVEACKKVGIESIVATTTFGTGHRHMWDEEVTKEIGLHGYYSSKASIEDAVRQSGLKYTILRPAFIHFNYFGASAEHNFPGISTTGELVHSYEENARMPHTDASDIGKYAAAALQNPSKFNGKEIELSNEPLTVKEARDIVARVSGREVRLRKRTPAEVEEAKTTAFAQRFHLFTNAKDFSTIFEKVGKVQEEFGIPFTSFEDALKRERDELLATIPA
ncbi:unnamed protein product [Clonostachys rhizophaga]|uniref:NmrA-like domain-containing protein n=1 Tax=Clonostachys rhizophaga TaxID=160324 RepID=A0A9N9YJ69_9HYPO|nr:unnamed protein product [Clonostachys rhizophaga]